MIDSRTGSGARGSHSYLTEAEAGDLASVGPFAYLRPGARLANGAKAGTFVEIKNSEIGEGAKVPHLAYVGDSEVGADANVGAGAITAAMIEGDQAVSVINKDHLIATLTEGSRDPSFGAEHEGNVVNGRAARLVFDAWVGAGTAP